MEARRAAGKSGAKAKRPPRKKVAVKAPTAEKKQPKLTARYAADGARVQAAHRAHDGDWKAIAKACGMSVGKAQRMYARAVLKPSERLYEKGLSENEMAREVRRLVEVEGLRYMPDVWARTGLVPARAKALYAQAVTAK